MILTHLIFFFFNQFVKAGHATTSNIAKFTASCSDFVKYKSECLDKTILISTQLDKYAFNVDYSDQHNFISEVKDDQLISNW